MAHLEMHAVTAFLAATLLMFVTLWVARRRPTGQRALLAAVALVCGGIVIFLGLAAALPRRVIY